MSRQATRLTLDFVVAATGGTVWRQGATEFSGVAIDGRAQQPGGLWFAIRGERLDGNDYQSQAYANGARGLVVTRGRAGDMTVVPEGATVVEVDDTTAALGRLARAWRDSFPSLEVVGIGGSNGKTTTKELCAAILAAHAGDAAVHKTEGNLNNHLGVPLTLLRLDERHRYAVIEMGMSGHGEMTYLAGIAKPDVGIIVSIGAEHLEKVGTIEDVARAEGELFAAIPPTGAIVFPDGEHLLDGPVHQARAARRLRFGDRAGVPVRVVRAEPTTHGTEVELRLPDGATARATLKALGRHHGFNAAAAAAATTALGVAPEAIARGLAAAGVAKHRSTRVEIQGRHVLDDCYNASPPSMTVALDTIAHLKGSHRAIAVLGDMLELGEESLMLHRSIGTHCAKVGIDQLYAIGQFARDVVDAAHAAGMPHDRARVIEGPPAGAASAAAGLLRSSSAAGDWILIKGSRGMQLERVIDALPASLAALQQEDAAMQHAAAGPSKGHD